MKSRVRGHVWQFQWGVLANACHMMTDRLIDPIEVTWPPSIPLIVVAGPVGLPPFGGAVRDRVGLEHSRREPCHVNQG